MLHVYMPLFFLIYEAKSGSHFATKFMQNIIINFKNEKADGAIDGHSGVVRIAMVPLESLTTSQVQIACNLLSIFREFFLARLVMHVKECLQMKTY